MKNKYFILLLVLVGIFYSCDKTEATRDEVEYSADRTKAPTINKKSEHLNDSADVFVGDTHKWKIDIEAANGIDSIFLDGVFKESYGNGQLKYSMEESFLMPDQDFRNIILMVKDEIGFKTTRKLVLTKGVYKSPYLIADFPFGGDDVKFLPANDARRVKLSQYSDAPDFAAKNFAWADVKVKSDIISPEMNIRYGSPGFDGQGNQDIVLDHWKECIEFGGTTAPAHEEAGETFALRLNLYPYKGNLRTMIALDAPINQNLIKDIVENKTRVIRIDVYVKTTDGATHPFISSKAANLKPYGTNAASTNHTIVGLGMANTVKFEDRTANGKTKRGQDHGMITTMQTTDAWETLTFAYNPLQATWAEGTGRVYTTGDLENNEVDMFILVVSPAPAANTSNATYYFRDFRIEEIEL